MLKGGIQYESSASGRLRGSIQYGNWEVYEMMKGWMDNGLMDGGMGCVVCGVLKFDMIGVERRWVWFWFGLVWVVGRLA